MGPNSNPTVLAIFTGLGTIVGYIGSEPASASIFDRLLWPARYYNSARPTELLWIALLMPMGGPIHKAAIEALDNLVDAGLWRGFCRGDMLGTAFYKNRGRKYVMQRAGTEERVLKDARDAFWITVLELVPWPRQVPPRESNWRQDPPTAEQHVQKILAQRPFLELELSREAPSAAVATPVGRAPPAAVDADTGLLTLAVPGTADAAGHLPPVVTGDTGLLKWRYFVGVVISETITIAFGTATAVVWKSPFATWYFVPLLLKLVALFCRVRRQPVKGLEEMNPPGDDGEPTLFEVADESKGFFLITGPKQLVYQFWHHYGHPLRDKPGLHWEKYTSLPGNIDNLFGDRAREVMSMLTIVAFIFVYPAGLIAFLFASADIQWVWLGYQLAAILSMHGYRFFGGEHCGSTQERLAKELAGQRPVCFDNGSGHRLIARLQSDVVDSVAAGRKRLSGRIVNFLAAHTQNDG